MATSHKALVQRWFDQVWNNKQEAVIYEIFHPEGRIYGLPPNPEEAIIGPAGFVPFWRNFISAVPDITVSVEDLVEEGNKLAVRCNVQGTHSGPGLGIEPSNARIHFRGIVLITEKDGKFFEGWNNFDFLLFYQQVGLVKMAI